MIHLGRFGAGTLALDGARVPAATARTLAEAQDILDAAREEAEQIRIDAREQGFAAGLAQGKSETAALLSDIHFNANRHVRDLEPVLADCVVHAVRMLIGASDPSRLVERAVLHVHERLGEAAGLNLRVSPACAGAAQEAAERLAREHGLLLPMRVVTDSTLEDGDCVVESSLGRAEARLEEQLARLREAVEKALAGVEAIA